MLLFHAGLAIYADGSREERKEEANEGFASQGADANDRGDSFGGHVDSRPYGPMSVGTNGRSVDSSERIFTRGPYW